MDLEVFIVLFGVDFIVFEIVSMGNGIFWDFLKLYVFYEFCLNFIFIIYLLVINNIEGVIKVEIYRFLI